MTDFGVKLVLSYLRAENLLKRAHIHGLVECWRKLKKRPELGLYLVEQRGLTLSRYVQLVSDLSVYCRPCPDCDEPRYVPADSKIRLKCHSCKSKTPIGAREKESDSQARFEEYDLDKELGKGAMGAVYLARYRAANRLEALKIMLPKFGNQRREKRFDKECALLGRIRHKNVIRVFRAGKFAGLRFMAIEFIEGSDLKDRMDQGLTTEEALSIIAQIADGLSAAHADGVVHRDLKPANILIDAENCPRVADFGLALDLQDEEKLTRSGAAVGTPYYMSPEQLRGQRQEVGPHSDVYALGVVLYEMLTGERPYTGQSIREVYENVMSKSYPPLKTFNEDLSPELETLIQSALEPDLDKRMRTAAEFRDCVNWIANPESAEAPEIFEIPEVSTLDRIQPLIWAAVVLIVLTVVGSYYFIQAHALQRQKFADKRFVKQSVRNLEKLKLQLPKGFDFINQECAPILYGLEKLSSRRKDVDLTQYIDSARATLSAAHWLSGDETKRKRALQLLSTPALQLNLAFLQAISGEVDEASRLLAIAQKTKHDKSLEQVVRGFVLWQRGKLKQALEAWKPLGPGHWTFYKQIDSLARLGQLSEIRARQRAFEEGSDEWLYIQCRLELSGGRHNWLKSWINLRKLTKQYPKNWICRLFIAQLAVLKFRYAIALKHLNAIENSSQESVWAIEARLLKAQILLNEGETELAEQELRESLELTERVNIAKIRQAMVGEDRWSHALALHVQKTDLKSRCLIRLAVLQAKLPFLSSKKIDFSAARKAGGANYYVRLAEYDNVRKARKVKEQQKQARKLSVVIAGRPQGLLELADLSLQTNEFSAAKQAFTQAYLSAENPIESVVALSGLARSIDGLGQRKNANTYFQKAASESRKIKPFNVPLSRFLIRFDFDELAQRVKARSQDAIVESTELKYLKRVTERWSNIALARVGIGCFELQTGSYERAFREATVATQANPWLWEGFDLLGLSLIGKGRYNQAREAYRKALELESPAARTNYGLALCYFHTGQFRDALPQCDVAIERDPRYSAAYRLRKQIYQQLNKQTAADVDQIRFKSFSTDNFKAEQDQINETIVAGNVPDLKTLLDKYPGQPTLLFDLGRLNGVSGQNYAECLIQTSIAVKFEPLLEPQYITLLNSFVSFGNIRFLGEIESQARTNAVFSRHMLFAKAVVFLVRLDPEKNAQNIPLICDLLHECLILTPEHVVAKAYLALSYALLGHEDLALSQLKNLPQKQRRNPTVQSVLGIIYARLQEPEPAFKALRQSHFATSAKTLRPFWRHFPPEFQRLPEFKRIFNKQ